MANTLRYGFKPHGGMHALARVTLGGTVTKGDILTWNGTAYVVFDPASHAAMSAVANEDGVSGAEIAVVLLTPETLLEVSTGLTYAAASHLNKPYDVTGATGAQYLTTTQTYGHFRIVGVAPRPQALDATGQYTNVLVRPVLGVSQSENPRRVSLQRVSATLSGAYTIGKLVGAQVYALDPGGAARDVTLPTAVNGLYFKVVNKADAAEAITVKDASGSTVCVIGQNEQADIYCTDTTWAADGSSVAALS